MSFKDAFNATIAQNLTECTEAEASLLFEMVDSSFSYISVGDRVIFAQKVFPSMSKAFDNEPMEVTGGDAVVNNKENVKNQELEVYV